MAFILTALFIISSITLVSFTLFVVIKYNIIKDIKEEIKDVLSK